MGALGEYLGLQMSGMNPAGRMAAASILLSGIKEQTLMLLHIFRGPGRVFGFTEDAMGANLPSQFSPWIAFKSIDLRRDGEPNPSVNTDECLDDIAKHGFHITDAHVRITESVV
jgi:hypothetical protein